MALSLAVCLLLLRFVASDFAFDYIDAYGDFRRPYYNYSVGTDRQSLNVLLDLNRPYSFVFGKECAQRSKCDFFEHNHPYNDKRTGGKATTRRFNDHVYDTLNLTGRLYEDTLKIGNLAVPLDLGVVDNGAGNWDFYWEGVLGLGVGEDGSWSSVVKEIMNQLSIQQIVWQEGARAIKRPGQDRKIRSSGTLTFGRYTGKKCGTFTWYDTKDNKHWQVLADFVIGDTTYRNRTIAFLPGRDTQLPFEIHKKHIPDKPSYDFRYPDIGFKIKGNTYKFSKESYAQYLDMDKIFYALLDFSHGNYDFGFGSNLLQYYCLGIRTDSGFKKLQIGLADQLR